MFLFVKIGIKYQLTGVTPMTISRKKVNNPTPQFAGIVVTASTREEAENRYRLAATGNDALVLQSESGSYNLVTTSANLEQDFHDVVSGKGNMVEVEGQQLDSVSAGDNENAEAFMTVCADGCGNVIIAEGEDVVQHCPSCSTAIPALSSEEIRQLTEDDNSVDGEYPAGHQGAIVSGSSFEEAHDRYFAVMSGEDSVSMVDDSTELTSESGADNPIGFATHKDCDYNYSPYIGEQSVSADDNQEAPFVAESSADNESFEGHYLLCESADCTAPHIITTKNEPVFCPTCSSGVVDPEDLANLEDSTSVAFEEDLEDNTISSESMDDEDHDEDDLDDLDDLDEDDMDDEDDLDDLDELEDEDDLDSESGSDDLDDEDDLESESGDEGDDSDDDEDSDDESDDDSDEDDVDIDIDDTDEDDDELESDSTVDFELNLLQAVSATEGELQPENVFVANCGVIDGVGKWIAFYGSTPVATLSSNNVSDEVSKIFNSPALGEAIKTSISENGVEQGLASIGFNAIKPDVDLEVAVSQDLIQQADSKVDTALASVEQRETQFAERFEAACATAIMGINRNAFKGVANPLADALVASISAAGVRNPEQLVQQAIASSADAYARTLLAQAKDISSKAPEVQNQIAETIGNFNFLTESSATVEPIGKQVQEPVAQPTVTDTALTTESSANSISQKVKSLNLGRR